MKRRDENPFFSSAPKQRQLLRETSKDLAQNGLLYKRQDVFAALEVLGIAEGSLMPQDRSVYEAESMVMEFADM